MAVGLSRKRQVMKPRMSTNIISALSHFKTPTKPAYWTTPVPSSVSYVAGGKLTIQRILASIHDKRDLSNTIVLLTDPDDPQRPSFLISTLSVRFFPIGYWCAYLYVNRYPDPSDYRLIGSLNLYLQPAQIPSWLTWRFLARHLRQQSDTAKPRRLRECEGLLIDPDLVTIALLYEEGREHNRLGLTEEWPKARPGLCPMVLPSYRYRLASTNLVRS